MTVPSWEWISASAIGTSHIRINRSCDDSGACIFVRGRNESALVAVCADGAGSAMRSSVGSRIIVRAFCRNVRSYLQSGGILADLSREVVSDWLDDMRGRIEIVSRSAGLTPRDFAATLVGCIIGDGKAKVLHVGDGAVVYRLSDSEEWAVGSWPSHGEYASTTYFVTDDPEPSFQLNDIDGPVSELAVFTDGIEHLVLNFSTLTAFPPFFNQMFSGFKSDGIGKNRNLSRHLCNYLNGPAVCDRTDDDKTLLLARRSLNVASQEHL
ncbi:protein phosphatase 2C domain-containing protein [Bradyrhizobium sp. 38]|uniref:PP2C family serine/threonine-protein phosphatase n=1 Tax=unclassified Bradyrhizobium TaxID=2631580 RepID=UPI001FF70C4C|nr:MULTISPECIES: PP2C family serine/threonine-protein phosphatase [unclassified Bradyrhizobium]MCK1334785.1 protein phosphatase 2C domain-containing protein [Bradyrhizobium sp. 38]MCK1781453.1 protein phosphatase 2C domain-containing protein [Bradyrhizobium sp. 132]